MSAASSMDDALGGVVVRSAVKLSRGDIPDARAVVREFPAVGDGYNGNGLRVPPPPPMLLFRCRKPLPVEWC